MLNSAWELQQWLLTFPEFAQNPAGAAHIVLKIAPQFEAKKEPGKPWIAKREGGKILLLDEEDDSRSFSIDLSFGDASNVPARLVRELQEAQELDSKYKTTGHVQRVLSLFYEDALMPEWTLEKDLPSEVRVPVETNFEEASGKDIWAILESRILKYSGLKAARSKADLLKMETAYILRNDPRMSLKDAFTDAFAKVHALNSKQSSKIRPLLDRPFLAPVEDKPLPQPEEVAYSRVILIHKEDLPQTSQNSILKHGGGVYSLGYGRVWWHKGDEQHRTQLAFSPYAIGQYPVIPILSHMGLLIQVKRIRDQIYLATTRGIWLLTSIFEGLPDWSGRMHKDIEAVIEQIQRKSGETPPSSGGPKPDGRGNILGEDGRTIFAGFYKAGSLLLGLMGAGILECLSRLVLSLGNLNLAWIEEGEAASGKDIPEAGLPPPAPQGPHRDIWPILEKMMAEKLNLKLQPGKAEEWKKAAAQIFRNNPGLEIHEALARSFAEVHRLDEKSAQKAESFLEEMGTFSAEGKFSLELEQTGWIYGLARLGEKTYLKTGLGLFSREDGRWKRETSGIAASRVRTVEFLDGRLYASNDLKIYVKEGNQWKPSLEDCGEVFQLRVIRGKLHAAAASGLWILEEGRWVLILPGKGLFGVGGVQDVAELDGELYAGGDSGVYVLGEEGPVRRLFRRIFPQRARWKRELKNPVFRLVQTEGSLYALAEAGLYGRAAGRWEREREKVRDVVKFGGRVYAGSESGLSAKGNGGPLLPGVWDWPYPGIGQVERFSVVQGRLYAETKNGLYVLEQNGGWARVKLPVEAHSIEEADGEIYLKTKEGLGRWVTKGEEALMNWRESVLGDIQTEIEKNRRSEDAAVPKEPFSTDSQGNILGEDGRTIFGGFQGASSFLLGLAGAGVLECLSRLALSLGNLNLGFAENAEPASYPFLSPQGGGIKGEGDSAWAILERWIQKELNIKLMPNQIEEWKTATAEILRSHPAFPIEKVLLKGLVKVHAMNQETREKAEFLIADQGAMPELKGTYIRSTTLIKGSVHLFTGNGLYKFKGAKIAPVLTDAGEPFGFIPLGDSIYLRAQKGLYRLEGDEAVPVLTDDVGSVFDIIKIGGSFYAYTDRDITGSLYKLKFEGGKLVPESLGFVNSLKSAIRGLIYRELGGGSSLYGNKRVLEYPGWMSLIALCFSNSYSSVKKDFYKMPGIKPIAWLPDDSENVQEVARVGNSVYVCAYPGIYRVEGDKAVPVLKNAKLFFQVWRIESSVYAQIFVSDEGWGLYRLEGDKAIPILPRASVNDVEPIGDSIYVSTNEGLYRLEGDKAVPLIKDVAVEQVRQWHGKMFIATWGGFLTWDPLPKNWRQSILKEISQKIGQMHESRVTDPSAEPLKADAKGNILGEDGRTIFSGIQGSSL